MDGRFSFKAIIVGLIVDVMATSIIGGIFVAIAGAAFFATALRAPGGVAAMNTMASNAATMTTQMTMLMSSPLVVVGMIVSGALGSLLGGYISGLLAPGAEIKNAVAMGALSLTLGLLMVLANSGATTSGTPVWATIVSFLLTIPAAACGGALRAAKTTPGYYSSESENDPFRAQ